MFNVISVDFEIRSRDVLNILIDYSDSLLDADIVIMDPFKFKSLWKGKTYKVKDGSKVLDSNEGSIEVKKLFAKRRQEIETLIQNDKVIFVFVSPLFTIYGQVENGSFKSFTNYDWLPVVARKVIIDFIIEGAGSEIILKNPSHSIVPYYNTFKNKLSYHSYLRDSIALNDIFFVNKTGNPVGWSLMEKKLIFIPYPPGDVRDEGLVDVLIQCAKPILTKDFRTPEPEWVKNYSIPGEKEVLEKIKGFQEKIDELNKKVEDLDSQRKSLSDYRSLLYEQGKPLEDAVLRSLRLMGFKAEKFKKGDMEHDVVMEAPEGRGLAEVEGKDNKAINIDKHDHLSRIVDEDFSNREEYSHGVLIGNPYRLTPPNERKNAFTDKVKISAKRKDFGLLTTVELFKAITKILENPSNSSFKKACRKAILKTKGEEISFPKDKVKGG